MDATSLRVAASQSALHRCGEPEEPSTCSPKAHDSTFRGKQRCLSDEDIKAIVERWNARNPRGRINVGRTGVDAAVRKLALALGGDHATWLESDLIKGDPALRKRVSARFRPKKPRSWSKQPNMWLSTTDILKVMRQYQAKHVDFKFLGVHPRDFTLVEPGAGGVCIAGQDVCDPRLKSLTASGVRHLGAVFNMDRHDQSGSHWVACFISLDDSKPMYGAYYYDSVARPPPPEIANWMVLVRKKVNERLARPEGTRPFELAYNKERRQFQNTECGMFAMRFLSIAIQNCMTFSEICNRMGGDKEMSALRNVMFR